jgi:hypothetical protein
MNEGSMKTIGDDTGCPGIGSNQIPMIQSLTKNSIHKAAHTNQVEHLPKWTLMDLAQSHPREQNQTNEE